MKMRVLTLGTCLAIAMFAVWYGFVLPDDVVAAPSGKCCLEIGGCVEVSSTECDAMCGMFFGPGTTCKFGPFPDCPIPPISVTVCCLPDDSCSVLTLCECENAGTADQYAVFVTDGPVATTIDFQRLTGDS